MGNGCFQKGHRSPRLTKREINQKAYLPILPYHTGADDNIYQTDEHKWKSRSLRKNQQSGKSKQANRRNDCGCKNHYLRVIESH
jgi:hypothetical protein